MCTHDTRRMGRNTNHPLRGTFVRITDDTESDSAEVRKKTLQRNKSVEILDQDVMCPPGISRMCGNTKYPLRTLPRTTLSLRTLTWNPNPNHADFWFGDANVVGTLTCMYVLQIGSVHLRTKTTHPTFASIVDYGCTGFRMLQYRMPLKRMRNHVRACGIENSFLWGPFGKDNVQLFLSKTNRQPQDQRLLV